MIRKAAIAISLAMMLTGIMLGCKNNPASPAKPNPVDTTRTVLFREGFEEDSAKLDSIWTSYMITTDEGFYAKMRSTMAAAHSGTHSITTDSNWTALEYNVFSRIETGIVGVEFYIRANAAGQTNFTVEIGQYAGSSGGLAKAFGLGFDRNDSVKYTYYNGFTGQHSDSMISPIRFNNWYKCAVEVDFTAWTVTYYLDDAKVRTKPLPALAEEMYGIDRVLVFRGMGLVDLPNAEGPKPYFADDIVFYKK